MILNNPEQPAKHQERRQVAQIHHEPAAFAYYAGAAQAQVVLATGCTPEDAAAAVRIAGEHRIGADPTPEALRDTILEAVSAVRNA